MVRTALIVSHQFSERTPAEFRAQLLPLAPFIAEVPGLLWKIWLIDDVASQFCGVYLFADEAAARDYLGGPIMDLVRNDTTNTDLQVHLYEVLEEQSLITRGPVAAALAGADRSP